MDLTFNIGTGPNGVVFATKVRTNDNKIYIGGVFDIYNGNTARRIVRLTQTGAFDTSFTTLGCESSVNAIVLQPDLKCIIGGDFTTVGSTTTRRLARLNDNGSLDTTFTANMGNGPDNGVDALAVQGDGKLLIGGRFLNFDGTGRVRLARLNADGSLDTGFVPGLGPNQPVVSINVQLDGKILVCGNFTSFNGVARSGIVRLLADGSVDTSFDPGTGASGLVNGAIIQGDGKIIVYGGFTAFNGQARVKIVRLLANGTIDTAYAQNTAINSDIRDAQLLPSGKLLIVGVFFDINGISRRSVARLDVNGAHDTLFNPGTGAGYLDSLANAAVNASGLDSNARLVVVGEFRQFNDIPFNFITRVNTADPTPPLVITHPVDVFIPTGSNATFSVTASGTEPLSYQWRFGVVNLAGATNASVTITNAQAGNVGNYSVVVANTAGSATSSNASLTLGTFPFFVTPPASQTNVVGANTNFTVVAGGTAPLFYQWLFNGAVLANQTNATLNLTNIQLTNGGPYTIIVSNLFGAVTNSATLTVAAPPAIVAGSNGGGADGQPQSLTVVQGQNATFSVNAIGSAPLTYQWRYGGANITGATNTSVTLTNVLAAQAGLYSVVIGNSFGNVTSSNATLTVLLPPTIIVQPVSQTITQGATLNLSVTATGSPTLTYQWSLNGTAIPGATAAALSLFNAQESLEGNYVCLVTNPYGTATSVVAVVTIQSPPVIYAPGQPQPQTVIQGSNATFSVSAVGDLPFTYQWRFGGTNIAGATNNPLVLTAVQTNQAGNYSVVVSNAFGFTISSNALLTVRVPPFIITQPTPANQTVVAGSNATITVVAGGDPTLAYQWRLNGTAITGATNATLTLTAVQTNQLGLYSVVVSNPYGTVTSGNATLDVKTAPFVVTQPQSLAVLQGSPAAFSVTAGGDGPFTYQWRFGGTDIAGANTAAFGLASAFTTNAGLYSVLITSAYGSVASSNATLTVNVPPTIVVPPVSQTVVAGSNATFTVTATGDAPLSYQWRFGGTAITGATSATLTLAAVQAAQAGDYAVVVTNPFGTATSTNATLTLKTPPFVATQPQSLTVLKGTNASFSVTAGGDGPFTYQWRFGGTIITDATNATVTLTNVQTNQAGLYSVLITSLYGSVTSSNATLTVLDPPVIVVQPVSASALAGETVAFSVVATGRPTLLYQWCKNGVDIAGATNTTLTLTNVSAADVADYCVKVTNSDGSVTSVNATFTLSLRTLQVVTTQTTNLTAGAAVSVPVALLAEGGEHRVTGSVAYDTNKLAFVSVTTSAA
ncbi:MAG: immunoglobulin domain-containing protein, partial [Limisphaerales bacterium]